MDPLEVEEPVGLEPDEADPVETEPEDLEDDPVEAEPVDLEDDPVDDEPVDLEELVDLELELESSQADAWGAE